jgi:hypothetical protein
MAETWYLAICLDCTPLLPQPFLQREAREEWATIHVIMTGHHVAYLTQIRRLEGVE